MHRLCPVRRLVWTAIGAAGGIWAYRKGSVLVEQARAQGVAVTIQQVALAATQTVNNVSSSLGQRSQRPQQHPRRSTPNSPQATDQG